MANPLLLQAVIRKKNINITITILRKTISFLTKLYKEFSMFKDHISTISPVIFLKKRMKDIASIWKTNIQMNT